jgi:hypothetical protein
LAIKPEGGIDANSDFSAAELGCTCTSLAGKQRAELPAGSKCGCDALALAELEDGVELAPSSLSGVREQEYIDPNQGKATNTSPTINLFDPLSTIRTKRFIVVSCSSMNNRYSIVRLPADLCGQLSF